jgi:hypothetical protein
MAGGDPRFGTLTHVHDHDHRLDDVIYMTT